MTSAVARQWTIEELSTRCPPHRSAARSLVFVLDRGCHFLRLGVRRWRRVGPVLLRQRVAEAGQGPA